MGAIQNFINRKRENNKKANEFEENDRIVSNVERKKLSHNEREMIAVLKHEKEEALNGALRFEEQRRKGSEMLREREMFSQGGFNLLE